MRTRLLCVCSGTSHRRVTALRKGGRRTVRLKSESDSWLGTGLDVMLPTLNRMPSCRFSIRSYDRWPL